MRARTTICRARRLGDVGVLLRRDSRPGAVQGHVAEVLAAGIDVEEVRAPAASRLAGRCTAISGSRPTMIVSLWWRVWLQRQGVDSRSTMKEAIS